MKIDRLIGIIIILLQKDKVTAPELAKRFEVSRRTINRDIEDICSAGIPVVTTQGAGGGISILDNYKIDKTILSNDELHAVLSGLKGIDSVSKTPYLANVIEKLSSKNNYIETDEAIIIDLASHYQKPLSQKIESIKSAIQSKQIISFRYCYKKGENVRRIEPYRLLFKWSSWYVFGYCLERNDYRLFKLNRLWNVSISEEAFTPREIPENQLQFDEYFKSNAFHLQARFLPSEKWRLIEEYGAHCYSVTESGELLFECDFVNYEHMRSWIFSFGDKVTILQPNLLVEDRKQQAQNILNMT